MKQTMTIATFRERNRQRVWPALENRNPLHPLGPAELEELKAVGRAQLREDIALLDQDMPRIDAEQRAAEAMLATTQLSARLRQFLYDVYEKG